MQTITGKTKLLGVFGHPISHTLSPIMHNALLEHLNIDAAYLPLPCEPARLEDAVRGFRALGFVGANVTIPFKEAMLKYVDELSEISKFMGSVNTLYWKDGIVGETLCGTTTDALGALSNLREHGVTYAKKRVAILGNGGTARALAFALTHLPKLGIGLDLVPQSLVVYGRNLSKVQALVNELNKAREGEMSSQTIQAAQLQDFASNALSIDIIINATSVGMTPNVNEAPIDTSSLLASHTVYDIVYTPAETLLLREAKARGCTVVSGIGMLIHQGAVSFEHWFPERKTEIKVSVMQKAINNFRKTP